LLSIIEKLGGIILDILVMIFNQKGVICN